MTLGSFLISRGVIIEPPQFLITLSNAVAERWQRRFSKWEFAQ